MIIIYGIVLMIFFAGAPWAVPIWEEAAAFGSREETGAF